MYLRAKHVGLLTFLAVAYVLLPVLNADYLYTIQDTDAFVGGRTFMAETTGRDAGWITWAACWLTQFFYYPWLGSSILIVLWVIIYALTIYSFNLKGKWCLLALILPSALLLQILDYGYWVYYTKTAGWAFSHTLFLLLIVSCAAALKVGVDNLTNIKSKTMRLVVPWLCHGVAAIVVIGILGPWRINDHKSELSITLGDKNFKREMRMYRALDEWRFDDVLQNLPTNGDSPTNLMVLYKNIALMHTGRMSEMFVDNNCGIKPDTGDSLQIRTSLLGAPLVYYLFGQMNYANRWAMENAVQYGLSFRSLKMMVRCAIFNQEYDVAAKYLTLLKSSIFHRQWAIEHERWIMQDICFFQSKEYTALAPLLQKNGDLLDGDDGLCLWWLLDHFSKLDNPTSPLLEDVALCMSLWAKDYYAFCIHFYDYANMHPTQPIPRLYQEGAILLGNAEESPITLDGFCFDNMVAQRYNNFIRDYNDLLQSGVNEKEIANRLKPLYGDTYWWYYYFYTDMNIY